jgi:hypothetical protein
MNKRFIMAIVAYIALTFACAVTWHLVFFHDYYLSVGMRKEPLMHLGVMSMLIQAFVLAYLYPFFYKGGEPVREGAKFGFFMGLFLASFAALADAGKFDLGSPLAWILHEGTITLIQFTLAGVMIGLIYGRVKAR